MGFERSGWELRWKLSAKGLCANDQIPSFFNIFFLLLADKDEHDIQYRPGLTLVLFQAKTNNSAKKPTVHVFAITIIFYYLLNL